MSKVVDHNFKILLLGSPAVGKTSLVNRFVHGKFRQDYLLTIGMEPYSKYETLNNSEICYTIFDIAGSQQFTKLRRMFYRGSRGALVVFDLTRKNTFNDIKKWVSDAKSVQADQLFILVGNKDDLDNQRVVKSAEAQKLADELGCIMYLETSAKTGANVPDAFNQLGLNLLKN